MRQLLRSASRVKEAHGFGKARFFVTKYVQFYPMSKQWVSFIDDYCEHHLGAPAPVEMIRTKFMRRFYSRKVGAAQRLKLLQSHYQVLETHLRSDIIGRLLGGEALTLGELSGKSGTQYAFSVAVHDRYRYEGDLTLFMHRAADNQLLAALTFSLGFAAHQTIEMRIGGLQGPAGEDAKQIVVDVTRDLHGLRPKNAVLDVFYDLAEVLQAATIEAVGMANHPLNDRGHAVVCNNDVFWEENGALRGRDGNYRLPRVRAVKTLEEVAAKKRKDWLARRGHKAALKAQLVPIAQSWLRFHVTPVDAAEPAIRAVA